MTQTPLLNQPSTDQRLIYGGITWQQFKLIQAGFAESPGVRLFYYNDAIEILIGTYTKFDTKMASNPDRERL